MLDIRIDPGSRVPPFEQIRTGVAGLARSGTLPAGTRLPTVRRLAEDLGVAVNTVARAYRELEQAGLVRTDGRHGTYVTPAAAGVPAEAHRLAAEYAARTRELGLTAEQASALVSAALSALAE